MSRPKLLLADDSVTIQRLVNLTFADEGFDIVTVGDGDSALREISSQQPDIVLADVNMPGPSGYEICSLLRSIDETANIPVILLVGAFEPFDENEAERVGASTYFTKPFQSIRQLVEQVKNLLSQNSGVGDLAEHQNGSVTAEGDTPDTTDIDTLYEQSFAETVEMPAEMAAALYARDRFDDEMIETSYTAGVDTKPDEFEMTPIVEGELEGPDAYPVATPGPEEVEAGIAAESKAPGQAGDLAAIQAAQTEEFRHNVRDPFSKTADDFDLGDVDILGLSPADAAQVEITVPSATSDRQSTARVVSISPELLDAIVQKVVEKLSEKY